VAVVDALGRRVVEAVLRETDAAGGFRYVAGLDLAGRAVYRANMDSGPFRLLPDVQGRPIRSLTARGERSRWRYDALRRPTHLYLAAAGSSEALVERRIFGEGQPGRSAAGRLWRLYDSSGLVENASYDPEGNLRQRIRQLAGAYRERADWSALAETSDAATLDAVAAPLLRPADRFSASATFDAIGRPVQLITPTAPGLAPNTVQYSYGRSGQPLRVDAWVGTVAASADPDAADLHPVTAEAYDEHGRCIQRDEGNGTRTTYTYDRSSGQLLQLRTARTGFADSAAVVQDLNYTNDPVGNVTRIRDNADLQNVVFFRNQRVEPSTDYTYDPLYRLIGSSGREHVGQTGSGLAAPAMPTDTDDPRTRLAHPGDGAAMARYTERYRYDLVGNLTEVAHQVSSGSWRRGYRYTEPSLVDSSQVGNRLTATGPSAKPPDTWTARYSYDANGNTATMPHLPAMGWDGQDRLCSVARQVLNQPGAPETTYYVYDAAGQRVRKVTDRSATNGAEPAARAERIYFGTVELYREWAPDGTQTLQRETFVVTASGQPTVITETRSLGTDPGPARLDRFQYTNHLGSAVLELDPSGAVISYEEYFPYGSTAYSAVRSATETPKRYRYTGKERDDETGLCYFGARYYAPWLGRWLSPDPSDLTDGVNFYLFCHANPVTLRDPEGNDVEAYVIHSGRPGDQWWGFFLGVAAHNLIAYSYMGHNIPSQWGIFTNYRDIETILTLTAIGDPDELTKSERALKPDIADVDQRYVWEIKPWTKEGLLAARKEVREYNAALNKGLYHPEWHFDLGPKFEGEMAVQFANGKHVWRLIWISPEPGVILYKWQRTNKTDRDEIREAGEGQWVDITEQEAAAYGKEVYAEVTSSIESQNWKYKLLDDIQTTQDFLGNVAMIFMGSAMFESLGIGAEEPVAPSEPIAPPPSTTTVVPPRPWYPGSPYLKPPLDVPNLPQGSIFEHWEPPVPAAPSPRVIH
jgi:RHS repeat-associated protein